MYGNQGLQRYKEADLGSMSPEKIIVMLYEKIISDLRVAEQAITAGDRIRMADKVNHSLRIVSELRTALDHEQGGEIAGNLDSLYDFLFHEHLQLLIDQNPARVQNCIRVIEPLLDAWRQITRNPEIDPRAVGPQEDSPAETGADPATYEGPQPGPNPDPQNGAPENLANPYQRMVSLPA